jgi:hypothetical protein
VIAIGLEEMSHDGETRPRNGHMVKWSDHGAVGIYTRTSKRSLEQAYFDEVPRLQFSTQHTSNLRHATRLGWSCAVDLAELVVGDCAHVVIHRIVRVLQDLPQLPTSRTSRSSPAVPTSRI